MTGTWTIVALGLFLACQAAGAGEEDRMVERKAMVETQLKARDIQEPAVLAAMEKVPRHRFIPDESRDDAYRDHPVPIGYGQTISQPYIVAFMTQAAMLKPGMKVLEVGTGSGYQAAILGEMVGPTGAVYSIEIVGALARSAERILIDLDYANVHVRAGDGYEGWPDAAPFDVVLITAAPPVVPAPLLRQVKVGGVLIAPVGEGIQDLVRMRRREGGYDHEILLPVRFVPMTGKAQGR